MKFRPLNKKEKELLFECHALNKDNTWAHDKIVEYVKEYYDFENADKLIFIIDSEYNDNYYDTRIVHVAVYDSLNQEMLPLEDRCIEARKNAIHLYECLVFATTSDSYGNQYYHGERLETTCKAPSVVVYLKDEPRLYVAEDD